MKSTISRRHKAKDVKIHRLGMFKNDRNKCLWQVVSEDDTDHLKYIREVDVYIHSNCKPKFTIKDDDEVNDALISYKSENDKRVRCEEWLKKKGFTKDEKGWSFNPVKTVNILKFPSIFASDEFFYYTDLRVKFHKILNVNTIEFPGFWKKKAVAGSFHRSENYCSLKNFPDIIDLDQTKVIYRNLKETDIFFYEQYLKKSVKIYPNLSIDENYLLYLLKQPTQSLKHINKMEERFGINCKDLHDKIDFDVNALLQTKKGFNKFYL